MADDVKELPLPEMTALIVAQSLAKILPVLGAMAMAKLAELLLADKGAVIPDELRLFEGALCCPKRCCGYVAELRFRPLTADEFTTYEAGAPSKHPEQTAPSSAARH